MPYDQVMPKFKAGTLHSGGPKGPSVKNPRQALAIMLSEKRKAPSDPEYRPKKNGLEDALGMK